MLTSRAVAAGAARAARVEAYGASSRAGRTPRFAGGGGSGGRLAFVRQRGASITLRAGGDGHGHSHSHGHPLHQAPVEEACCSADDCAASVSKQHSHSDDKPYSPLEGYVSPHPFAWNRASAGQPPGTSRTFGYAQATGRHERGTPERGSGEQNLRLASLSRGKGERAGGRVRTPSRVPHAWVPTSYREGSTSRRRTRVGTG
jgi:hypothetical protein